MRKFSMDSLTLKYSLIGLATFALSVFFMNCSPSSSSSVGGGTSTPQATYVVQGTLTGLATGQSLALQNNGSEILNLSANESFAFNTSFFQTDAYSVSILTAPAAQTCEITNATGSFTTTTPLASVRVVCRNTNLRLFFTAAQHAPNFANGFANGIAGADAFCMADSLRPIDMVNVKAMIVSGTDVRRACSSPNCGTSGAAEHIDWVFKANQTYARLDGTTIIGTTNSLGLLPFPLQNGLGGTGRIYWTGMTSSWETSGLDCNGWSGTTCGTVYVGHDSSNPNITGSIFLQAFGNGVIGTGSTAGLVCVEQ